MKAVCYAGYGEPIGFREVAVPEIRPDQVLVRVRAAALNPLDVKLHGGERRESLPLLFPYVIGTDLVGTVERVGSLVTRWKEGDEVVAGLGPVAGGALADFAVVPARALAAAPPRVDPSLLAGLPIAAGTAWHALFEVGGVGAGSTVLIHGGAGGVGSFAIQLARMSGARVVATASGDGVDLARRLGAEVVVDYRVSDFAEGLSGVDMVLDSVGGDVQRRSFAVLQTGGILVSLLASPDPAIASAHGVRAARMSYGPDAGRLKLIAGLVDAGRLEVVVDGRYPLSRVGEAFARQASGRARGKIIVDVG